MTVLYFPFFRVRMIGHGAALDDFMDWYDDSYLDLNVGKTTEMIMEFRRQGYAHVAIQIHGEPVEIVTSYKYLSTIFEDILKWDLNTKAITKKGRQQLHLLCKLRLFNVDPTILKLFYNSFIESVLTFSFICWFYNLNVKQKKQIINLICKSHPLLLLLSQRTVNFSSKIICDQVRSLFLFCDHQMLHKVKSILNDLEHTLSEEFELLPHGHCFRSLVCKTNRRSNSFIPTAVWLLNRVWSALLSVCISCYQSIQVFRASFVT